jgi:alanine racemase
LKRVSREGKSRAWAEIDRGALVRNLDAIRARADGRRVIAVVKADAYGHGARTVARTLAEAGCDAFAVATIDEALELRDAGVRELILLLTGLLEPGDADQALARDVTPVVSRLESLAWLEAAAARAGREAPFQLKLDTGMGRLGLAPDDLPAFLARLRSAKGVRLDGVMSHLAEADDATSAETERQRALFAAGVARVRAAGYDPAWIHVDNSAGIARGATPGTNAVRPGLSLWGADPLLEGGNALEPVMSLFARICHAKVVPAGTKIGYGGEFIARETSRIFTLAIGYADGLPRAVGGKVEIGWRGRRIPLVGRVSCDLASAAAPGDEAIEPGDAVLIFGRGADGLVIPVEEIARAANTVAYEILARIGPRIPRIAT